MLHTARIDFCEAYFCLRKRSRATNRALKRFERVWMVEFGHFSFISSFQKPINRDQSRNASFGAVDALKLPLVSKLCWFIVIGVDSERLRGF